MLNLLIEAGCEKVQVPTKYYFTVMGRQTGILNKIWTKRLELAAPHLIKKGFGSLIRDLDQGVIGQVDWERVPSILFVDMVLGLDCLVQLDDGTVLGVDCTTTEDEVILSKKKEKLIKLQPLLEYLGIDAVVVCQVQFNELGFTALKSAHKQRLVKGMRKVLNKDYSSKWLHRWALDLTNS